jgi:hypothetical protein
MQKWMHSWPDYTIVINHEMAIDTVDWKNLKKSKIFKYRFGIVTLATWLYEAQEREIRKQKLLKIAGISNRSI